MQRKYHSYIRSPEWREKANAAKRRSGYRCQICNKSGDEVQLDTHHRTYERLGDEWPEDLIVLCRSCHRWHHLRLKLLEWRGALIGYAVIALGLYLLVFGFRNPLSLWSNSQSHAIGRNVQNVTLPVVATDTPTPRDIEDSQSSGTYTHSELRYPDERDIIADLTVEAAWFATIQADLETDPDYQAWKRRNQYQLKTDIAELHAGSTPTAFTTRDARASAAVRFPRGITKLSTPTPIRAPQATGGNQNCKGGCMQYPSWCAPPIKGNVSFNSGEKIYHVPGQEYYDETTINTGFGERWFCTEAEARAAGWRKSKR